MGRTHHHTFWPNGAKRRASTLEGDMPVEFCCVSCQARYEVSDDLVGKTVRCRECELRCYVGPPDEPMYFRAALGLAATIYRVVNVLTAVGYVVCAMILVVGLASRHSVEAVVVGVVAWVQFFFAKRASMLLLSLTEVFVGIGRDVRALRTRSGET